MIDRPGDLRQVERDFVQVSRERQEREEQLRKLFEKQRAMAERRKVILGLGLAGLGLAAVGSGSAYFVLISLQPKYTTRISQPITAILSRYGLWHGLLTARVLLRRALIQLCYSGTFGQTDISGDTFSLQISYPDPTNPVLANPAPGPINWKVSALAVPANEIDNVSCQSQCTNPSGNWLSLKPPSVTITGSGFTNASGVSFGGTSASGFTVDSDTQITATSPVGSGTVTLTVKTPNGTATAQFTYT